MSDTGTAIESEERAGPRGGRGPAGRAILWRIRASSEGGRSGGRAASRETLRNVSSGRIASVCPYFRAIDRLIVPPSLPGDCRPGAHGRGKPRGARARGRASNPRGRGGGGGG